MLRVGADDLQPTGVSFRYLFKRRKSALVPLNRDDTPRAQCE